MFEDEFLSPTGASRQAYRQAIDRAAAVLAKSLPDRPYTGKSPVELTALISDEPCPIEGMPLDDALRGLETIIANSVAVSHPFTAAHLHCPPLIPALAAEVVLSALNQSMDSFDQAPAATILEQEVLAWLCREAGLPASAGGTLTPGGSLSNYMGLLLARDAWCRAHLGWSVREQGLPPEAKRFRILCSEMAHFTVEKSAAQLGLGAAAVIKVAVDRDFRMCPDDLDRKLQRLANERLIPLAIVGTAGTTDFGSIDPLPAIAQQARRARAWLHVDAAYGGALLFSDRHRHRLCGLDQADSVTLDFHKLFWQPISAGAFLLRDMAHFDCIAQHADYLNPESHEDNGIPDLVTSSVLTTRRFDALKIWFTLRVLGRAKLAAMIDHVHHLADTAAAAIRRQPCLELIHQPTLACVVFRMRARRSPGESDRLNEAIRRHLFDTGQAVIGHTRVRGQGCLKLTLLNPCTAPSDVIRLIELIVRQGEALDAALPGEFAAIEPRPRQGPSCLRR